MNGDNLLRLVPPVLRARGWRLYTKQGRLVDLWQFGGRAILGHKPPGLLRALKNNAERGLFTPFPHFAEDRLHKALSALFPGFAFRLFENEDFLYRAINDSGLTYCIRKWRPFLELADSEPISNLVLPCPFPGAPAIIAFHPDEDIANKIPPSQLLSPVSLAAAARCIYDLLAAKSRGNSVFPRVFRALKKSTIWKRQGIYLFFTANANNASKEHIIGTNQDYPVIFRRFLEGGFLLPPSPEEPAILPGELSPGEEAKLAGLLE
jgi:hypothetical protein